MEWTFLRKLVSRLSQDVFRPVPAGLLYETLQTISREISGECPWDLGSECYKGYSGYYADPVLGGPKCRNITCPGYLNPLGLIAYTSRSVLTSSIDNRFDYNSFRFGTSDDFVPVGTLGAEVKFDFGAASDSGGYGAYLYGALLYGGNSIPVSSYNVHIGDRWEIHCLTSDNVIGTDGNIYKCKLSHTASAANRPITGGVWSTYWKYIGVPPAAPTRSPIWGLPWQLGYAYTVNPYVSSAIPVPGFVLGTYGPIVTGGTYTGDFDTYYTVEIIDYWGWIQNFHDALYQISLATATNEWVDYWGEYFGLPRLLISPTVYEDDSTYKARIMKEITRAKGTKPVLEEEANAYYGRNDISIIEYHQTYVSPPIWTAGTGYVVGDKVRSTVVNNFEYICVVAGGSGATEPSWPTVSNTSIVDGAVTWVCKNPLGQDRSVPLSPPNLSWPPAFVRGANQPYPWSDPDPAWGLQPYQFYIFPPTNRRPGSKWVKTGSGMETSSISSTTKCYGMESSYYSGGGGYGPSSFTLLTAFEFIDGVVDWLFIAPPQMGDAVLFASTKRFSGVHIVLGLVPGVGGTYAWEYWGGIGTGWIPLIVTDTTSGFTVNGYVDWKLPLPYGSWPKDDNVPSNIPNVGTEMYWIRCRVVTAPTQNPEVDYAGIVYAGVTNRGNYNATNNIVLSAAKQPLSYSRIGVYSPICVTSIGAAPIAAGTGYSLNDTLTLVQAGASACIALVDGIGGGGAVTHVTLLTGGIGYTVGVKVTTVSPVGGSGCTINITTIAPAYRDVQNIYIYSEDSFVQPTLESGLQDIIDRLKTAGTVCIINSPS